MAKFYGKLKGADYYSRLNLDGTLRKNASIPVETTIDLEVLSRKVARLIKDKTVATEDGSEPKSQEMNDKERGRHKSWLTSYVGGTMLASSIISSTIKLGTTAVSGDKGQAEMETYNALKGAGMLAISTFGGPIGMAFAVTWHALDSLVGEAIRNQIHLQYDNSRLSYNLTRYDIGRNSTYTYDYDRNMYIATDTQRIRNNVLNEVTSD